MGTRAPGFGTQRFLEVSSASSAFLRSTRDGNQCVLSPARPSATEAERRGLCKGEVFLLRKPLQLLIFISTTRLQRSRALKHWCLWVFESQREETSLGFDLESFSQNWVYRLFAVTLETELCKWDQALGLKGRTASLSQVSARNVEAQQLFPPGIQLSLGGLSPMGREGTSVSDLQIQWWES